MTAPQKDTPLSINQPPQQVDTPLTVTPSPMNMPGAQNAMNAPVETMTAPKTMAVGTPETKAPEGDKVDVNELQAKYKGAQEIARRFEKVAKEEHDDAERYRQLRNSLAGNGDTPPDPMAEVTRLRQEIEAERTERIRERIARETGAPPSLITGADEASMKSSAEQAIAWANSLRQPPSGQPAVATAETVTTNTPPHQTGVQQIQSRDELKGMSSKEIMAAYNDGRLDFLMGKSPK